MPNWCSNDLYIDGPSEKVEEALALIGDVFDFDKLIPYPPLWKEMDLAMNVIYKIINTEERAAALEAYRAKYNTASDGYNAGGYEWCNENWGTKWNLLEVTKYEHPTHGTCLTFDSAWSPPLPVIEALANKFPELRVELNYFECGAAYCGGVIYEAADEVDEGEPRSRAWQGDYAGNRGG